MSNLVAVFREFINSRLEESEGSLVGREDYQKALRGVTDALDKLKELESRDVVNDDIRKAVDDGLCVISSAAQQEGYVQGLKDGLAGARQVSGPSDELAGIRLIRLLESAPVVDPTQSE